MPAIYFSDRFFQGRLDPRDGPLTAPLPVGSWFEVHCGPTKIASEPPAGAAATLDRRQAAAALEAVGCAARMWSEIGQPATVRVRVPGRRGVRRDPLHDLVTFAIGRFDDLERITGRPLPASRPEPAVTFEPAAFRGSMTFGDLQYMDDSPYRAMGSDDAVDGLPDPIIAAGYAIRMWHEWDHQPAQVRMELGGDTVTVFTVGDAADDPRENPAPVQTQRDLVGRRVRVHYNLHRCPGGPSGQAKPGEACFVVSEKVGGAWKVTAYVSELLLEDADFKVSLAGVRSIREKGQRAVVAWINGTVADAASVQRKLGSSSEWEGVSFNPFKADTFYRSDGRAIETAPLVYLSGRRAAVKLRSSNPGGQGAEIRSVADLRAMVNILGGTLDGDETDGDRTENPSRPPYTYYGFRLPSRGAYPLPEDDRNSCCQTLRSDGHASWCPHHGEQPPPPAPPRRGRR